MPRRDEQEYEERRQQIISGALIVFAEKGFEQATTKEIARASGIGSPGLIYHYFKDKADLLREVVENRSLALQMLASGDLLMDRPPHEVLDQFGRAFLASLTDSDGIALFRVMLGEALRRPTVAEMLISLGPSRALDFLTRYLRAQMDAGLLRRTDPGAAARCFFGPLLVYVLSRAVFPMPESPVLAPEAIVSVTVETFLRGMDYRNPNAEQGGKYG